MFLALLPYCPFRPDRHSPAVLSSWLFRNSVGEGVGGKVTVKITISRFVFWNCKYYSMRPKNQYGSAKLPSDEVFWLSIGPVSNNSNTTSKSARPVCLDFFLRDHKECSRCHVLCLPLTSTRHDNVTAAWEWLK